MKLAGRILLGSLSFLLVAFVTLIIGCGTSNSTVSYVGTQSPGDYWTWAESNGSFTAVNKTTSFTYSGNQTTLSGNSSGITKLTVASSTDPSIHSSLPVPAYAITIPNTMVMAAVPPFATVNQPTATLVSEHGPVVAAVQGSCPANGTTTQVDWIMMPRKDWCPADNTPFIPTTQAGTTCPTADSAYGTASIAVDASGNYAVNATAYKLGGNLAASQPTFSQCSCSSGVIQCTDNNSEPVKIAFTPSGVFIMDTANYGLAGVVQSNITAANFSDFYANGNTFKGMSFWSFDDPNGWAAGTPETALASMSTDGAKLTYRQYSDIDAGTLSASSTSVALNNAAQTVAPGLITTTFTNCDGNAYPMAIALAKMNGKYVGFAIGYSPGGGGVCPNYTHGFNVLAIQQ